MEDVKVHKHSSCPPGTFPANGIRKGSVQKIPRRANAIREVLTAIDNSIGNSGGITEVIISEQLSISLYLLLVGSSSPCIIPLTITYHNLPLRPSHIKKSPSPFISRMHYLNKHITSSN